MSWAAHELESYVIQRHLKVRMSYTAILAGCLMPDMFTKWAVYGVSVGGLTVKPTHPWHYHREWVGAGPTHSLAFGVFCGLLALAITKHRGWALGLMVGMWAHALTDTLDSVGTMLFFPFSTHTYSLGMWAYAGQKGHYGDAAAYYSSLGGVWDAFWLVVAVLSWRVFTRRYFVDVVLPTDPVWARLRRRFHFSETTLLAMYRAYFLYAGARILAWFLWARLIRHAPFDPAWGGPYWVPHPYVAPQSFTTTVLQTLVAVPAFVLALYVVWRTVGRRLWRRAYRGVVEVPDTVPVAVLA